MQESLLLLDQADLIRRMGPDAYAKAFDLDPLPSFGTPDQRSICAMRETAGIVRAAADEVVAAAETAYPNVKFACNWQAGSDPDSLDGTACYWPRVLAPRIGYPFHYGDGSGRGWKGHGV